MASLSWCWVPTRVQLALWGNAATGREPGAGGGRGRAGVLADKVTSGGNSKGVSTLSAEGAAPGEQTAGAPAPRREQVRRVPAQHAGDGA